MMNYERRNFVKITTETLPSLALTWRLLFLAVLLGWTEVAMPQQGPWDPDFLPRVDAPGVVKTIVPVNNGQILVGGSFNSINDVERYGLARLNLD